jgi:hypothetical protein
MADVVSTVSSAMAIAQGVVRFLDVVKGIKDADVISALFGSDGERKHGDERIEVVVHQDPRPGTWWNEVAPRDDYSFVRFPVIESRMFEVIGMNEEADNPDARYWRWIAQPLPGRLYGGESPSPSGLVDFVVVGYRPKALVEYFSS